ncbi:MAG: dienelactone hydrolase family protein [Chloroflexi bacterium]|nr:dienelactone hydrolase family protein [Chloroflexota bacterium]
MCYDNDARPPEPPQPGGKASGKDIELISADGNHFAAYLAQPAQPKGAQVLIYPDIRGLHQFYKDLALRFAEQGIRALAIDYFGRTAGLGPRDDTFDFRQHLPYFQFPAFLSDVAAALAYLGHDSNTQKPTFTLGFCMGGSLSLLTGTEDFDLAGIIGFYAGLSRTLSGSQGSTLEMAPKIHYPLLGLFGGADQGIPVSDVHKLDAALDEAGVDHKIIIYPEAPHSFFDRKFAEYAEASADAWQQVLGFIAAHSAKA